MSAYQTQQIREVQRLIGYNISRVAGYFALGLRLLSITRSHVPQSVRHGCDRLEPARSSSPGEVQYETPRTRAPLFFFALALFCPRGYRMRYCRISVVPENREQHVRREVASLCIMPACCGVRNK